MDMLAWAGQGLGWLVVGGWFVGGDQAPVTYHTHVCWQCLLDL